MTQQLTTTRPDALTAAVRHVPPPSGGLAPTSEDRLPWWVRRSAGQGLLAMIALYLGFTALNVLQVTTIPPVPVVAAPPAATDVVLSSGAAASASVRGVETSSGSAASTQAATQAATEAATQAATTAERSRAAASKARIDRRREERKLEQVRREVAQARAAYRNLEAAARRSLATAAAPPLSQMSAPSAFDPMALAAGTPVVQRWVAPLTAYRLTARFGQTGRYWANTHTGLDLAAPTGTPVMAVAAGTVTFAGDDGPYGQRVAVTHADGTETWYAHLSSLAVAVGSTVVPGGVVGAVGTTGNVSGPHLHLEVRPAGGDPVDPETALHDHGVTL